MSEDREQLVSVFVVLGLRVLVSAMTTPRKRISDEFYFEAPIRTLNLISDTDYMRADFFV
jgi:hypothetical protein